MADWRTSLLSHFVPGVKPIIAVSDPDGLLREPTLLKRVEERGFVVVFFEDSLSFRVEYETRIRRRRDAGELLEMVVSFEPREHEFEMLPVDVLAQARQVRLHLKDIFPRLSYDVIRQLEPAYYDALYAAYEVAAVQPMGEALTKDFVLRHLFAVDGSLIAAEAALLSFLCRLHYTQAVLPDLLVQHLERTLQPRFSTWPVGRLLRDRALFLAFLQERWPIFVEETDGGRALVEEDGPTLRIAGPRRLPFEHHDVRIFIDNFFSDGLLAPIAWSWTEASAESWIRVGLLDDTQRNPMLRLSELLADLRQTAPSADAPPGDWQKFSLRWGQARMLWLKLDSAAQAKQAGLFAEVREMVRERFRAWVLQTYPRIHNVPAATPAMVHHAPAYLARMMERGAAKRVALVLIDGLALEQWAAIKDVIKHSLGTILVDESAVFAWAPTITPVSRQATFAGKIPAYFADTILETSKDEQRWRQFWTTRGLYAHEIVAQAIHGDDGDETTIDEWLTADTKAIAVTFYKVDKIMHGMQLGAAGMLNQVELWANGNALINVLQLLLARGFSVLLTADHGNTEATGIGAPKQGVLCDVRGERCRIFGEARFAEECVAHAPGSRIWQNPGLPPGFIPVVAPAGKAFVAKGTTIVCHGGDSLEELAVPFVLMRTTEGGQP
jgi:hypothetical protein